MTETLICNVCDNPASYEQALEVQKVYCNVRKFRDTKFTVWRCTNCLSLHSKEAVDLDHYYFDYPMKKQSMDFSASRAYRNRLRHMQKHGLRRDHSVLDYGCGKGLFVSYLQARGITAAGYDPYVAEFSDTGVLDREFDFITSQDVIEHVSEPRGLVRQYARILKKGGMLVIGTPNASEIKLKSSQLFSMELHQPYHRHLLSEAALIGLCRAASLQLVDMRHRFYYDTIHPMVNAQFVKRYINKTGGYLDAAFEKPQVQLVLSSPELLFFGFFGYFVRACGNMLGVFRRAD